MAVVAAPLPRVPTIVVLARKPFGGYPERNCDGWVPRWGNPA